MFTSISTNPIYLFSIIYKFPKICLPLKGLVSLFGFFDAKFGSIATKGLYNFSAIVFKSVIFNVNY